jgi:hypothetical protein
MSTSKPFLLEVTGQADFHLGNPAAPIGVDIAVGYRKRLLANDATESFLFASVTALKKGGISVKDIIESATTSTQDIPTVFNNVKFNKFSVSYGKGGTNASKLTIALDCKITINENEFDASISIGYEKDESGKVTFDFKGVLKVGAHRFKIQFVKKTDTWYLFAGYLNTGKVTIDLKEIAGNLFKEETVKSLPEISFTLDRFKAFFLYKKGKEKSNLLFGMGANLSLDLSDLPMAGPILTRGNSFAFKEVLAIYAKDNFSKEELQVFEGIPKVDIASGFNITTELQINGILEYHVINGGETPQEEETPNDETPTAATNIQPLGGAISSKAKWKKLDKRIGPVHLQRLGFAYDDGKVILLLDASMTMIGLGVQLMGFGLGFKLEWPPSIPDFYLDGLGLSYSRPPIEISGAFLHSTRIYKGKPVDEYSGGAIIKINKFSISAIGAYAEVESEKEIEVDGKLETKTKKESSLFIYGVFDGPIGGPAFFFVTGIAAGFGYNRRVNVPSINEVATYPLVALAMQPQKAGGLPEILQSLETPMKNGKKPIEISVGDFWLAIGIKFTSFVIIESFVLLTVNFGTKLEFAILGLSRLVWPDKSIAPEAIVYVELAVLAHFGPGSDVISVEAVLTPNSYILSSDCKLTGGFAFYTWVSGPHEGDFVITLGGYHPKFKKPAHYPTVPRVGLHWKIGKFLSIKGELYFALTSSAIMAGGRWEVLFKTSIVKVSIILWADMLISWAPFQYDIDIGITLRIEANIKILFVRIHFNLEMGAQLHIWGPPFAGEAHVNWVIFSFTIPFGGGSKIAPEPLKWHAFSKGFIPQGKQDTSKKQLKSKEKKSDPISNPDPINITINNGLIAVKGEHKFPVINPHQLAIAVDSFIPVTTLKHNDTEVATDTTILSASKKSLYKDRNQEIGVRPCDFIAKDMDFKMNVSVSLEGTAMVMRLSGIAKGVAEALWGANKSENSNTNPGTATVMSNVLTGVTLLPPLLPQVAQIRAFDFSQFVDKSEVAFQWSFTQRQLGAAFQVFEVLGYFDTVQSKQVKGILQQTFIAVKTEREQIASALQDIFGDDLPDIQESEMADVIAEGPSYFRGVPILVELGKIPQFSTDVTE